MEGEHCPHWARFIHRVKWRCPFCSDEAGLCLSSDLLVRHVNVFHEEEDIKTLNEIELKLFKIKCRVFRPREPNHCPLCNWPNQKKGSVTKRDFLQHFIDHLRELALWSTMWWDRDMAKAVIDTPVSDYGSVDTISQIDADQRKQTYPIAYFSNDVLEELENTRDSAEIGGQSFHRTLERQQRELWERLEPVLQDGTRLDCERIRGEIDWTDLSSQGDLLKQLSDLLQQLRLKAGKEIPLQERFKQIVGDSVEPPYAPLDTFSRSDVEELGLDINVDDNTAVDQMMKLHSFAQESLPLLELAEAPDYDKDSFRNAIRSANIPFEPVEDGCIALSSDNLNKVLTPTFIKTFFYHLVGSVSSIRDEDEASLVRYCTNEVQNQRIYFSSETKEEKLASRRKLFAISSLIEIPAVIIFFIRHGVSDLDLPLQVGSFGLDYFESQSGRTFPLPIGWSSELSRHFLDCQRIICGRPEENDIGSAKEQGWWLFSNLFN